ncbi:ABC transporter permease [Actinomycetospora sp. NBRC 106378]|uniref:ABC transporter permease n=1 Tax=Actinomycetospora sp. NBRC 106378 TaxID=3032208 RepID=UPI00249FB3DA|nr:ABC transporter permease [Actinomycetospora sp. NBRC 106378]GLZ54417.1 ABC transporter permease [Actinomycetospora sp. NBRC 106378]
MIRRLASRLAQAVVTLLLASLVIFLGVRALPGDPALAAAGEEADPATLATVRAQLGLDQPLVVQYLRFLGRTVTGDLGTSTRTGEPVSDAILSALPVTLQLSVLALLVAVAVGIVAGVLAARYRGRWPEWLASVFSLAALSVPVFWLGLLAVLYLAVGLGAFPASGYVSPLTDPLRALHHLILPAVIVGLPTAAVVLRQTRASMLGALDSDFVRTARATGLSENRVVWTVALRNSLVVLTTIVGLQLGTLIAGAAVTERIFGLPGLGKLTLDSVFSRDYPVVQAVVLVVTAAYVVINLLVDVLYSVVDPRIRVAGAAA